MTRMPQARRSLDGKKVFLHEDLVVPNGGHPHGKPNGRTTASRVRTAITRCHCGDRDFFATAFDVSTKSAQIQEKFNSVQEVEWFKAFESGDILKLPESYEIPECVRLLADKVLGEILPSHHCPKHFFRGLQGQRRPIQSTISPAAL